MPIESLRAYLEQIEAYGELLRFDGADREATAHHDKSVSRRCQTLVRTDAKN
jgi:hypothetical protein